MSNNRTIMHVDMNAFFASVEQQVNPSLRHKPVAVIGSHKRTVVTTASYEARAYGVKVGMTVPEAKKLCPDIIFVAGNNKKYTDTCTRLVRLYKNYTPLVEVYSVDEAFLDITASLCLFNNPEDVALQIKEKIRRNFGLTCSIGIGPNKLLAKLASNMKKPDGLTTIHSEVVPEILEKLPVSELCGIGSKLEIHLESMGVKTCGELGRFSVKGLKGKFGIIGERLHQMGLGVDESPVVPVEDEPDAKSVGHSMTLVKDYGQMLLFKKDRDRKSAVQAMDEINDRYGEFSIVRARLLDRYHHKGVIAPAWRPSGVRRST